MQSSKNSGGSWDSLLPDKEPGSGRQESSCSSGQFLKCGPQPWDPGQGTFSVQREP